MLELTTQETLFPWASSPECPRAKKVNNFALLFPLQFQTWVLELIIACKKANICIYPLVKSARESENIWARVCPLRTDVTTEQAEPGFPRFDILDGSLLVLEKQLQHTKTGLLQVQISSVSLF